MNVLALTRQDDVTLASPTSDFEVKVVPGAIQLFIERPGEFFEHVNIPLDMWDKIVEFVQ